MELLTGPLSKNVSLEAKQMFETFWQREMESIQNTNSSDFRNQELPLARIKKIMKLDEDVKMISGEAPVLFAKAVEIFIAELSIRAWINTEENKRRTVQRHDVAMAVARYDQFDFLIDIVPREETKTYKKLDGSTQEPYSYLVQLATQQLPTPTSSSQSIVLQTSSSDTTSQPITISPQFIQVPVPSASKENNIASIINLNDSSSLEEQQQAIPINISTNPPYQASLQQNSSQTQIVLNPVPVETIENKNSEEQE